MPFFRRLRRAEPQPAPPAEPERPPEPVAPPLALKLWATIIAGLDRGDQSVILLPGGRAEAPERVEADRFYLYPLFEEQRHELLLPEFRELLVEQAPLEDAGAGRVSMRHWVRVSDVRRIEKEAALEALAPFLVVDPLRYPREALGWQPGETLWVLVVRVFRMRQPRSVPWREAYAAPGRWVTLDAEDARELPPEPPAGFEICISDTAFSHDRGEILKALAPFA
ncbi:MAG: DUF1802 family protein [Firmicutes bacterium]|nr:DUF1802 family protein [Bacillota bacterium]